MPLSLTPTPSPWKLLLRGFPHHTELSPLLSTSILCLSVSPTRFPLPWMKGPSISQLCTTASFLSPNIPYHGME